MSGSPCLVNCHSVHCLLELCYSLYLGIFQEVFCFGTSVVNDLEHWWSQSELASAKGYGKLGWLETKWRDLRYCCIFVNNIGKFYMVWIGQIVWIMDTVVCIVQVSCSLELNKTLVAVHQNLFSYSLWISVQNDAETNLKEKKNDAPKLVCFEWTGVVCCESY